MVLNKKFYSIDARSNPMCFKFKEKFCTVGSYATANDTNLNCKSLLCCDRYNLHEGKLEKNMHLLPYPLNASDKVCTDAEEAHQEKQ